MSDRIVFNFHSVARASEDISRAITQMNQQLHDCESAAKPLVSTWEGNAQQAYLVRQTQWRQAAESLARTLTDIKRALDVSAQEFQATEDRNTKLFT